jgi:hypothetical protein
MTSGDAMLHPGFEPVLIEQEGEQSSRLDLMIDEDLDDGLITGIIAPDASCGPTAWPKSSWYIKGMGRCAATFRSQLHATHSFPDTRIYDKGNHDSGNHDGVHTVTHVCKYVTLPGVIFDQVTGERMSRVCFFLLVLHTCSV